MSGLTDILPAPTRQKVYLGYALTGAGIGATQVGFTAAQADTPTALTVALAIYAYIGIVFGFTAAANTNQEPPKRKAPRMPSGPYDYE